MTALTMGLLIAGFVLLAAGAEALVRGASRMALALGITPLVVGLTVVAFGTSSPELITSVAASLRGQADISVGNVVGSNILNTLLILGLSAVVAPLTVARKLVRFDVPVMIVVSVAPWLMALDGGIGRLDGALLFAGILAYVGWGVYDTRREKRAADSPPVTEKPRGRAASLIDLGLVLAGLAMLALGSRWLVIAAETIARALGVSELVIGLTIVALGTSLPEVATSVLASIRGERDIAVGNVVGSNLFNILAVLGATGLVTPGAVAVAPSAMHFDLPVMIAAAVVCWPIFFSAFCITRWEGALLLASYVLYTVALVVHSTGRPLPSIAAMSLWVLLPAAFLAVTVPAVRQLLARAPAEAAGDAP